MNRGTTTAVRRIMALTEEQAANELRRRRTLVEKLSPTIARADWQTHPRFFGSIASHFLGFHEHFRQDLAEFIHILNTESMTEKQRIQKVGRSFGSYKQYLHLHHSIEEQSVFPKISSTQPHLKPGMAMLDHDHEELDRLIAASTKKLAEENLEELKRALLELQKFLLRHLEDEEDLLVPLMLQGKLSL